jgi:membrane protease YdiL (CAAX protease family)
MSLSKQIQNATAQLKSVDFWLFVVSFISSGFILQDLGSIPLQLTVFGSILAVAIVISVIIKRKRNWTRKDTGWKGPLYAIGTLLFVGYAICSFSIHFASRRGIELAGSFLSQAITALSDPMTFGGFISFMYLGIYSAAAWLGLTDLPDTKVND